MFGMLSSIVGPSIKHLAPILAGWGLNKLFNSGMIKNNVPSILLPSLKNAAYGVTKRIIGESPQE